ncbi:hypothetical protein NP233_g11660 [Leucocoprinus birnbaumii]|uniref:Protein kinase domain-containing protein n=1 Tax=Leucocoprinus birnbaumii TaxID=56174 RepID=A0AAD5VJN7_9AGAR|nr:hypothetical protein NP233_g11660 [Leucocoprinus birnbaumii]
MTIWSTMTGYYQVGLESGVRAFNIITKYATFLCTSTLAFTSSIIDHIRTSITGLEARVIETFSVDVSHLRVHASHVFKLVVTTLEEYTAKILKHLEEFLVVVILVILDVIWFLIQGWQMDRLATITPAHQMITGPPIRLLIEGPPIRLLITEPAARLLITGGPTHLLIAGPSTHLSITAPPARLLITGPPNRLLITGPPSRLLITGLPTRLLITGPPAQLLLTGPPRLLISHPLTCLLITGPAARKLITILPTRLTVEAPTSPLLIESCPVLSLSETCLSHKGASAQRLVQAPLARLVLLSLASPLVLPSTRGLTTGLPIQYISTTSFNGFSSSTQSSYSFAPTPLRSPVTLSLPPPTLEDSVLPQGETDVFEMEAGAEVPTSGTIGPDEDPVSHHSLEDLPVHCIEDECSAVNNVAPTGLGLDVSVNVENWGCDIVRTLDEFGVHTLAGREGSPALGSDTSSTRSLSSSDGSSPDPSSDISPTSSNATTPEIPSASKSSVNSPKPSTVPSHTEEGAKDPVCGSLSEQNESEEGGELTDPLDEFNRNDPFLRNITVPDFQPVAISGFGIVWKGVDQHGQAYAVKVVSRDPQNDENMKEEIRAMKMAQGSQWTTELFYEEASPYDFLLVTEWCSGGDLFDRWGRAGGYFMKEIATLFTAQILLGIHNLHLRGIVHRDIKFKNIMVQKGRIKIIDFGLAATFDHERVPSKYQVHHILRKSAQEDNFPLLHAEPRNPHIAEGTCGTPGYCPPEVFQEGRYSFGVDYYAMAVMYHAMLTSEYPYYFDSTEEHYDHEVICIDSLGILDEEYRDFFKRTLAHRPRDRLTVRRMKAHPVFYDIDWKALERGTFIHPALFCAGR